MLGRPPRSLDGARASPLADAAGSGGSGGSASSSGAAPANPFTGGWLSRSRVVSHAHPTTSGGSGGSGGSGAGSAAHANASSGSGGGAAPHGQGSGGSGGGGGGMWMVGPSARLVSARAAPATEARGRSDSGSRDGGGVRVLPGDRSVMAALRRRSGSTHAIGDSARPGTGLGPTEALLEPVEAYTPPEPRLGQRSRGRASAAVLFGSSPPERAAPRFMRPSAPDTDDGSESDGETDDDDDSGGDWVIRQDASASDAHGGGQRHGSSRGFRFRAPRTSGTPARSAAADRDWGLLPGWSQLTLDKAIEMGFERRVVLEAMARLSRAAAIARPGDPSPVDNLEAVVNDILTHPDDGPVTPPAQAREQRREARRAHREARREARHAPARSRLMGASEHRRSRWGGGDGDGAGGGRHRGRGLAQGNVAPPTALAPGTTSGGSRRLPPTAARLFSRSVWAASGQGLSGARPATAAAPAPSSRPAAAGASRRPRSSSGEAVRGAQAAAGGGSGAGAGPAANPDNSQLAKDEALLAATEALAAALDEAAVGALAPDGMRQLIRKQHDALGKLHRRLTAMVEVHTCRVRCLRRLPGRFPCPPPCPPVDWGMCALALAHMCALVSGAAPTVPYRSAKMRRATPCCSRAATCAAARGAWRACSTPATPSVPSAATPSPVPSACSLRSTV